MSPLCLILTCRCYLCTPAGGHPFFSFLLFSFSPVHLHASICSSSATSQPVDGVFALSLCCTPECDYLLVGSFYTCLVHWFLKLPPRGHPLDRLALEARGVYNPGSQETVTIWETVLGRLPTQRTAQIAVWNTPPVFLWKTSICLSKNFSLRDRILVFHIIRGLWRCSQGMEACGWILCALPLPCSSSPVSPRKELISMSGTLIFADATRGHLYITCLWWPVELMSRGPTGR